MKSVTETMPLVSILVVTYQQKEYITQTLESLLMQDCDFPYEILIGEDCSTDGTRERCQELAAKHPDRIRLFLNEKNKGFINNYFDILDQARGTYLADCGGDDYWIRPDKLRRQVEIMENHPQISAVFANWQVFDQKSGQLKTNQSSIEKDWFYPNRFGSRAAEDYLNRCNFPRMVLSTALLRMDQTRALVHEHPNLFRGQSVVCEDLPLTLGLLCKGPIYLMKEEVMVYRVLEKSVSHATTLEGSMKGFTYKTLLQTWDLAESLHLRTNALKPYLQLTLANMVHFAFVSRDQSWMEQLYKTCQIHHIPWSFKQHLLYFCSKRQKLNSLLLWFYNRFHVNKNAE